MKESEYDELLALLDRLIVDQEDKGKQHRADELAETYSLVEACQKDDLNHG